LKHDCFCFHAMHASIWKQGDHTHTHINADSDCMIGLMSECMEFFNGEEISSLRLMIKVDDYVHTYLDTAGHRHSCRGS
jgi:hypothetical protein